MPAFHSPGFVAQLERLSEAALQALTRWDIPKPRINLLKYRENAVYQVVDADEQQFVLRVHRANYHSEQAVRSELSWMNALQASTLRVPEVILNKQGELYSTIQLEDEHQPRVVDVLSWIEGVTLTEVLSSIQLHEVAPLFHRLGALTAALHNHASAWQVPAGFSRHHWDVDSLLGEQPFWGRFWELSLLTEEQRKLVLATRKVLAEQLQSYPKTRENYSLIHADMIPENLMLAGDALILIDFDDAGFGFHLFELATITRRVEDTGYYDVAKEALFEAYQQHRGLTPADWQYWDAFVVARALSYLGWFHQRPELIEAKRVKRYIAKACAQCEAFLDVHH